MATTESDWEMLKKYVEYCVRSSEEALTKQGLPYTLKVHDEGRLSAFKAVLTFMRDTEISKTAEAKYEQL